MGVIINTFNKTVQRTTLRKYCTDFIECGQGIIPWQEVVHAANEFSIPYMFVEQDHTTYADKYESLAVSRDYLLSLDGLEAK